MMRRARRVRLAKAHAARPQAAARAAPRAARATAAQQPRRAMAAGAAAGAATAAEAPVKPWSADAASVAARAAHPNLVRYVEAFRKYAHHDANLDMFSLWPRDPLVERLRPEVYGLHDANEVFDVTGIVAFPDGRAAARLADIQAHLDQVYRQDLSLEAAYVAEPEERAWLQDQVERALPAAPLTPAQRRNLHTAMLQAETFDHFMGRKFTSFKRYGMEGIEALSGGVEAILRRAAANGVEDVVLGMPHRGRLNLLVGLLAYPARALFRKIRGSSDIPAAFEGDDDVVSHIAQSVTKSFGEGTPEVHVSLLHNPSHLEAVNPVSQGKARHKQELAGADGARRVMCLQMHGDAAFAGQGVVPESLAMANLPHYSVHGTVHVIVNNQVGFTTQYPNGRSTRHSSDMARMIHAPVLHVNGENPEAVVRACELAVDYRARFGKDVVVDLVAYRRHGHNEVDEPSFTQPMMYKDIRARPSVVAAYGQQLEQEGLLKAERVEALRKRFDSHLNAELEAADSYEPEADRHFQGRWAGVKQHSRDVDVRVQPRTGVEAGLLASVAEASVAVPDGFAVHPRLKRSHVQSRLKAVAAARADPASQVFDWATAEQMAWGSLMAEGHSVRISGQDVERGTFSQRHGALVDQETEARHFPLHGLAGAVGAADPAAVGRMHYAPSPLSEFAVMGFELGWSWETPNDLAIWEAQFGDFWNGAQIIVDTFLGSSEAKWLRQTGLTLLLPHGFDGAGPEHSSCRVERFLQLVDADEFATEQSNTNMVVAWPSTPASYFHLMRRQLKRDYRKPLVVVGPKVLLRHPKCVSSLDELSGETEFRPVLGDAKAEAAPEKVRRVVFTTGKLWYDLDAARNEQGVDGVALVRLEEINPFPFEGVRETLAKYPNASEVMWAQEEPTNAGCWSFVAPRLRNLAAEAGAAKVLYSGRRSLAAPATGSGATFKEEAAHVVSNPLSNLP